MLERIVASIVVALVAWLEGRAARGRSAVDADTRRDALDRAGDRIREWMRKQDGAGGGGKPDQDGA